MMPLLEGRIDRKTFIIGSAVGLGILLTVIIIFIIPIALIDIVVNSSRSSSFFKSVYYIFVLPATVYAFYFSVLAIKRAHDINFPGVPLLLLVGISEVISRLTGWWLPHLLALLILLMIAVLPGKKASNKFGSRPPKRFHFANIRLDA